jgi:hypothetical protein
MPRVEVRLSVDKLVRNDGRRSEDDYDKGGDHPALMTHKSSGFR